MIGVATIVVEKEEGGKIEVIRVEYSEFQVQPIGRIMTAQYVSFLLEVVGVQKEAISAIFNFLRFTKKDSPEEKALLGTNSLLKEVVKLAQKDEVTTKIYTKPALKMENSNGQRREIIEKR